MKKVYIVPSMVAYQVKATAILADSSIPNGGSNKGRGIDSAESKTDYISWDEDYDL